MKRDGSLKSIWQDELENFAPSNPWQKDKTYDVLIIGGGVTGLTTALLLQEQGKKCILAEGHNIAFGTSGGTTAHLNTLLDAPYYQVIKDFSEQDAVQLAIGAREAIDLVEGLVSKYRIDCDFAYKTGYLFAENEEQVKQLEKIKEGNDKVHVLTEWCDNIPVPIPFKKAVKVPFQAQVHATKYLGGLAKAFEQLGGVILQRCVVNSLKEEAYVTADSCLGLIKATDAIYATHMPPGINIFSFRCAPYRSYAIAFSLKNGGQYPDGLIYDCHDPYHYIRTQNINGQDYIIAGGFDHKTAHNNNTEYVFTELEAYAARYFDIDTIAYKWSSQYYEPVDGLPYIGQMPENEHVYTATGFSGNGYTLGTLAAKTLCAIIGKNETPYGELFDTGRIKVVAGFRDFVKENADVVGQFIGGKFSYEKISQLVELAPGEAAIAEWEGKKVALYKDERGHIFAVDPTCKHAGCTVNWNTAEKTWDCPCHGARYAPNGDFLNSPTLRGLDQIKWEDIEGD